VNGRSKVGFLVESQDDDAGARQAELVSASDDEPRSV
jgi:hypothetical protein